MTLVEFAIRHRLRMRRDVDSTEVILGKYGHIYEYGESLLGVLVMPVPPRRQYWGHAKVGLLAAGFQIRQDADGEGAATFDPTDAKQAKLAMRIAGIKRKRVCSPAQLVHLAVVGSKARIKQRRVAQKWHSAPQDAPI